MSTDTYILLSVLLAVVVIAVLAIALIRVRQGLEAISQDLASLASALDGVESEHLRPLEPAVKAINAQFDIILGALPGIARKAAISFASVSFSTATICVFTRFGKSPASSST